MSQIAPRLEDCDHGIDADPPPLPEQLAWQKAGLGVFFHIGVNTFAGQEWSDSSVPAAAFAPEDPDADEWVRMARDLGANLLLNVPPDRRGRIDPQDLARAQELGEALRARFGDGREATLTAAGSGVAAQLPGTTCFDHVELREDVSAGQRVRRCRVLAADGTVLAEGATVGVRRIHRLPAAVEARSLRLEVEGEDAVIEAVIVHDASGAPVPELPQGYRAPTEEPAG